MFVSRLYAGSHKIKEITYQVHTVQIANMTQKHRILTQKHRILQLVYCKCVTDLDMTQCVTI